MKNTEKTIKECIDSVLKQNYPRNHFKIFIVDGGSTDNSFKILKKYGRKIMLKRVIGNIATGHNYIIKHSNSDLIAFTDSDCVVDNNWLKELIKPFKGKNIGATGGLMKTPSDVNRLQKLIGWELESRTQNFPEFLSRAPTANLCVRTKLAKEILFDESFTVAQETDFGFRFTQKYKMKYVPKAIVYHYHRATWRSYFKQQFRYGTMMPKLYLRHKNKAKGDQISTGNMVASVLYMYVLLLSLALMLDWRISLFFATIVFSIYLTDIIKITKNLEDNLYLFAIFFVRNLAWNIGILFGLTKV